MICRCGQEVPAEPAFLCKCGRLYITSKDQTYQVGWQGKVNENIPGNIKGQENQKDSV